jgi:hypothetical protein
MRIRLWRTAASGMAIGALLLLLLPGSFRGTNSAASLLAGAGGLVSAIPRAYLPFVAKNRSFASLTPSPTHTPVPGCSTAPVLIAPADGSTLDTLIPVFQADSGTNPNATDLQLEACLDRGFTDCPYRMHSESRARGIWQHRPVLNLAPATTHYWRAYLMCGTTRGPHSEVWSFTTGSGGRILPGPDLVSPADGATLAGVTVSLEWSPVSGAVQYQANYQDGGWWYTSLETGTKSMVDELLANTSYEWWVQARNDYAWGAESPHWQFSTGSSGPAILFDPF